MRKHMINAMIHEETLCITYSMYQLLHLYVMQVGKTYLCQQSKTNQNTLESMFWAFLRLIYSDTDMFVIQQIISTQLFLFPLSICSSLLASSISSSI